MREFQIGARRITDETPAYVIAELGHNHGGSFDTARQMIQSAARSGADAVKLQKRDIDTLYSAEMLAAPYAHENSFGSTYGTHRRNLELGLNTYIALRTVAQVSQVTFFATAFDEVSADLLMEVGVPAIKLASSSLTDLPLLRHVRTLGVPLVLSTGGGTLAHVDTAVAVLAGVPLALLHCTAAYPMLTVTEANLRVIEVMRARYPDHVIGWSSHDPGIMLSIVAYAYGARIIEKHVTLNRASKGTDHAFSLEPRGLATLCEDLKKAHGASGDGVKRLYESERKPLSKMQRSWTADGWRVTGRCTYDP